MPALDTAEPETNMGDVRAPALSPPSTVITNSKLWPVANSHTA